MANCRKVHAGHFLAKNLGGSGGVGHVFPQTPGINMGLYRAFEMDIAKKIDDHGSGKVDILFKYPNANSKMPNAIFYTYEVGGKRFSARVRFMLRIMLSIPKPRASLSWMIINISWQSYQIT